MTKFEVIDHTADIGIVSYGTDLKETFANSAYGMFSLIAELNGVNEEVCLGIEVTAPDQEALLVAWLNELLYLSDVERIIFKRFEIVNLGLRSLQAKAYGEKIDPSRHQLKMALKAATYHMLRIEEGDGFRARVIFDV